MKFTKFTKYTGEPADSVDLEELVKRLGDFFSAKRVRIAILRYFRIRPGPLDGGTARSDSARAAGR